MTRFYRPHAVQHAIAHAAHFAAHHRFHLLHHDHPHHGVPHVRRPVAHGADVDAVQDLEQRVLMSATHLMAAVAPVMVGKAAPAPTATHAAAAATAAKAAAGPVAVADPVTTDAGYVYKSFAGDPLFAPSGPSANDVSQGELGDCYLLSVLSSVAKTDSALIRQTVVPNANGTYTVSFAGKTGGRTAVTVDGELPTLPDGRPAYAQLGADNSLWVSLYEKAYADFVNPKADRYATISGGWMGDAFTALGLKSGPSRSGWHATATTSGSRSAIRVPAFRPPTRSASSTSSSRSTIRNCARRPAPGSACRSRGGCWPCMGAASSSTPLRARIHLHHGRAGAGGRAEAVS